jgi:thiamine biosynthesis lipoprotein
MLACLLAAAPGGAATLRLGGATMGTTWSVVAARAPAALDARRVRAAIERTLARVDREASTWRADSELSRFNDGPSTAWSPVSAGLATVVGEALRTSRLSGGAFDPTVAPLVDLWGFGPTAGARRRPAAAAIRAARARIGFAHLAVRTTPPALRKDRPDLRVDLSAVAKGFAADRVAAGLAALGAHDVLVEIGGELRARGRNPDGAPWAVAVQRPTGATGAASAVLRLTDGGIATSGDYRNHFDEQGHRYGHVIDPRTGEPVTHALASVTVVAASAMRADALATALLVLGPEAGAALARRDGLAALFITRQPDGFRTTPTAAMRPYMTR